MTQTILKDISDDIVLLNLSENDGTLYDLYNAYLEIEESVPGAVKLEDTATGKELKAAIEALPGKEKLRLINIYANEPVVPGAVTNSTIQDDLRATVVNKVWNDTILRRFIVKAVLITALVLLVATFGAALTIAVMSGKISDGVVVNTMMNSAMEIVKLIFGFSD